MISTSSNHSSDNESLASSSIPSQVDSIPRGPDSGIYLTTGESAGGGTSPSNMGDWADDFVDYDSLEVEVPPPPPESEEVSPLGRVVALYGFDGEAESNIPMV